MQIEQREEKRVAARNARLPPLVTASPPSLATVALDDYVGVAPRPLKRPFWHRTKDMVAAIRRIAVLVLIPVLLVAYLLMFFGDGGLFEPAPVDLPKITNSIGMKLALLPKGTFLMGVPASENQPAPEETQHSVTISNDYYLGVYEVTQAEYQRVMGKNPSQFKEAQNPVEKISWTMRSRVPVAVGELQPTTGGAREVKAAEREVSASDDHLWLPWHEAQGRPAPLTVHRFPEFGPPSGDEWLRGAAVW